MTEQQRKPTVLVTGGSGMIGGALLDRIDRSFEAVTLERTTRAARFESINFDLASDDSVREALMELRRRGRTRIASVVHLAAHEDFSGDPNPLHEAVSVEGTRRLLHGLRDFDVEQFIFSSTMLVHAPCRPGQQIDESSPVKPTWEFPRWKVCAEQVIREERGQIPAVMLRLAGIYTDRCESIALAHQIHRIREKTMTSRVYPGKLSCGQAYLHLDDLGEALQRVVERRDQLPEETVLLLGEPETLSYDSLQREIARLLHDEEWDTQRIPKALARNGAGMQAAVRGVKPFIQPWMIDHADDHYALNIRRAQELLDWTPRRRLRDTLPTMIAALEADPDGWYRDNELID